MGKTSFENRAKGRAGPMYPITLNRVLILFFLPTQGYIRTAKHLSRRPGVKQSRIMLGGSRCGCRLGQFVLKRCEMAVAVNQVAHPSRHIVPNNGAKECPPCRPGCPDGFCNAGDFRECQFSAKAAIHLVSQAQPKSALVMANQGRPPEPGRSQLTCRDNAAQLGFKPLGYRASLRSCRRSTLLADSVPAGMTGEITNARSWSSNQAIKTD